MRRCRPSPILRTLRRRSRGSPGSNPATHVRSPRRTKTVRADFMGDNRDQRAYGYWRRFGSQVPARLQRAARPIVFLRLASIANNTGCRAVGWLDLAWGIGVWNSPSGAVLRKSVAAQSEFSCGFERPMPFERGVGCLPVVFTCTVRTTEKHHTRQPSSLMRRSSASAPRRDRPRSLPPHRYGPAWQRLATDDASSKREPRLHCSRPSFGWGTQSRLLLKQRSRAEPPPRRSRTPTQERNASENRLVRSACRVC